MKTVLTIAGSDSSGGAGIQADIKTISAHLLYATSVITAVTAQNTTGVFDVEVLSEKNIKMQLEAVLNDILPDAIKIGMIANLESMKVIRDTLKSYNLKNVIYDPVMISTSGRKLMNDNCINMLKSNFLDVVDMITPNIPEAEVLTGVKIETVSDMKKAAIELNKFFKGHILIKGGHLNKYNAVDILYSDSKFYEFKNNKLDSKNTHGTGCTLSSAIACNLALEYEVNQAVYRAKDYVYGAIRYNLNLGQGNGPLYHFHKIKVKNN